MHISRVHGVSRIDGISVLSWVVFLVPGQNQRTGEGIQFPTVAPACAAGNEPNSDNHASNLDDSPIPDRILEKMRSIPEIFVLDDISHGHTTAVEHQIKLNNEKHFKEWLRPIQPTDREAVKQHLRELLDAGIVQESQSLFASSIVLVRKKNGSKRLCVCVRQERLLYLVRSETAC